MSSFFVDQFMQVKCKFQLTSETDSSESVYTNNERIRLCSSIDFDKNSKLIVLICSNETGNNHIIAYYTERRTSTFSSAAGGVLPHRQPTPSESGESLNSVGSSNANRQPISFARLAQQQQHGTNSSFSLPRSEQKTAFWSTSLPPPSCQKAPNKVKTTLKTKPLRPKIIVKQIYYHNYNEDISTICLSSDGNKLILVSASCTIYILPIKNILLNLRAKQLRSSQGKSMYFYDALILTCCVHFEQPVSVVYWQTQAELPTSPGTAQSGDSSSSPIVIVANKKGQLSFINVDERRQINSTSVGEPIKCMQVIRDKFSYSLLITCDSFNQYRLTLEPIKQQAAGQQVVASDEGDLLAPTAINLPPTTRRTQQDDENFEVLNLVGKGDTANWNKKPIPIKLHSNQSKSTQATNIATAALQRVFVHSSSRFNSRAMSSALADRSRQRSLPLICYQQPDLLSVIDALGVHKSASSATSQSSGGAKFEPRLLRFYSGKQYYYRPQKPLLVCKLNSIETDEMITNVVLTDRFVAITTDRDRCLVNSRNCCNLRSSATSLGGGSYQIELEPTVKEISFCSEEKIMLLTKSPTSNDQDNIIDSFLLVTSKCVYSIEARQNCRDMFISLLDAHLAIKPPSDRIAAKTNISPSEEQAFGSFRLIGNTYSGQLGESRARKTSESNLMISSFLSQRDDVYERICYDSRAFSILFKLDLGSLYEAYADRSLQRQHFELANRFFQMAKFSFTKILGKYIRLGEYKQTVEFLMNILTNENEILEERERLELSKAAFDCLLAKTICERAKSALYSSKLGQDLLVNLVSYLEGRTSSGGGANCLRQRKLLPLGQTVNLFEVLCDHSPRSSETKLSANTIVVERDEATATGFDEDDDEATMTNTRDSCLQSGRAFERRQLECEKALISHVKHLLPSSVYNYALSQLVDFDLVELLAIVAKTSESRVHSLLRILIRAQHEEERVVFRDNRLETLVARLNRLDQFGGQKLVKINLKNDEEFLEFITSPQVTRALVNDIGLTCEYFGYRQTFVQFRKYSFAALKQLETYKSLLLLQRKRQRNYNRNKATASKSKKTLPSNGGIFDDEDANDGEFFSTSTINESKQTNCDLEIEFTKHQKQMFEKIFVEFLSACLDESTEDSCRVWFNYINFYLNNLGTCDQLESDILNLVGSESFLDCRVAITLFRAIHRDETSNLACVKQQQLQQVATKPVQPMPASFLTGTNNDLGQIVMHQDDSKQHNLAELFQNEFLMRLLERTLNLVSQAVDLDTLSIVAMC